MYKEDSTNRDYVDSEIVRNFTLEQRATWDEVFVCRAEIEEIVHRNPLDVRSEHWITQIAAYLLAKVCGYNEPFSVRFDTLKTDSRIDENILAFALENHIDYVWMDLLRLIKKHRYNIFCLNVLLRDMSDPNETPDGVAELARSLLGVQPGDNAVELCCGTGRVISSIKEACPSAKATGYDSDLGAIAVAKAHNEVSGKSITFEKKDVFTLAFETENAPKFNRIFANYPFGKSLREIGAGKEYRDSLTRKISSISKATSSDWLFNMLMTEMLADNGRAVGIMTNGSTWNMMDAPIRKYFVENGLIECVIALPSKLFGNTSIATSMIVFSHGNNGVRLVDASAQCKAGRRTNELTAADVDAIIGLVTSDGEKSIFVETRSLRENDYVLNISRYVSEVGAIKDGAPFETVIKRITRGAPLNAKELDAISSSVPTDMQYLMLSNIQNGLIDDRLPYLSRIDEKNEKYCLTNRCLIMSKNGYPYKIAVADVKEGQKILANGNLYLIELDEKRANPYYLAAFFGSELGTAALKSITVGATIPNIGVDQLKRLIIPLPSIEKQKELASRYQEVKDEILMLQLKIERARDRMAHLFEEEE